MAYNVSVEDMRMMWGNYVVAHPDIFGRYWVVKHPPPHSYNLVLAVFIAVVFVASVLGNGLICLAILRSKELRNGRMFAGNVALSDFLSALLTYHMFVRSSLAGHWIYSKQMCFYYAIVQGYMGIVSMVTLAVMSLQRWGEIASCVDFGGPSTAWVSFTPKRKIKIIIFIWIYCFWVVSPPLVGVGDYVAAGFLTTCCYNYIPRNWNIRCFIIHLFFWGFIVPMSVIAYSMWEIYRLGVEERRRLRLLCRKSLMESVMVGINLAASPRQSFSEPTPPTSEPPPPTSEAPPPTSDPLLVPKLQRRASSPTSHISRREGSFLDIPRSRTPSPTPRASSQYSNYDEIHITEADLAKVKSETRKAIRQSFIVIGAFIIAWTPYGAVSLLGQFGPFGMVNPILAMVPSMLAKSSTVYNPVIYAIQDKALMRSMWNMVMDKKGSEGGGESGRDGEDPSRQPTTAT